MLIGLLADTHDRVPAIDALVREMLSRGVGMILHAGDFCSPFSLKPLLDHNVAMAGVFGRNDGDYEGLKAYAASASASSCSSRRTAWTSRASTSSSFTTSAT
jgi:predicted phosphodiesterase